LAENGIICGTWPGDLIRVGQIAGLPARFDKPPFPAMQLQSTRNFASRNRGSGLVDVLIVIATVALLVMVLPGLLPTRNRGRSARIGCVNNLKCIGLAARMWSNENGDEFPWNVSMMSNGVMEIAMSGNLAALFSCMSNELNSPRILFCPNDTKRRRETNFANLSNKNISYFIGLDADETKPQTILSGDRNISGGPFTSNRVMFLTSTNVLVWGKDIHAQAGNLGLGDGSAQQLNQGSLQKQMSADFQSHSLPTVRFALP
jgi:hypothetical protein